MWLTHRSACLKDGINPSRTRHTVQLPKHVFCSLSHNISLPTRTIYLPAFPLSTPQLQYWVKYPSFHSLQCKPHLLISGTSTPYGVSHISTEWSDCRHFHSLQCKPHKHSRLMVDSTTPYGLSHISTEWSNCRHFYSLRCKPHQHWVV